MNTLKTYTFLNKTVLPICNSLSSISQYPSPVPIFKKRELNKEKGDSFTAFFTSIHTSCFACPPKILILRLPHDLKCEILLHALLFDAHFP